MSNTSIRTGAGRNKYSYGYNHGHETYSPEHTSTSNWVGSSLTSTFRQDNLHISSYASQTYRDSLHTTKRLPTSTVSYNQDNLQISSCETLPNRPVVNNNQSQFIRKVSLLNTNTQRQTSTVRPDRRCLVCNKIQTNMKKHVATSHLGNAWWGVIADISCWKCRLYQNKESIGRCNGAFNQSQHSHLLLQRHQAFYRFLMEDLGCSTPQQLISLAIKEVLCAWSTSPFTMEEMNFLNLIDNMMGTESTLNGDPQNPTRLKDLTHWKTLANIIKYASLNGTITGPAIPSTKHSRH